MRLYEDFHVGDVYRSAVGRTVTETDNLLFTMLTMNTNELHFNEEAAARTEWGRILVNSTFTLALVLGLSVTDTSQARAVNLGWESVRLPSPVFVGDTLRTETEVLGVRESASRPAHGIVTVRTRGVNQRDETVIEFERSFMIPRRASS
jgi:acyl dehydratase